MENRGRRSLLARGATFGGVVVVRFSLCLSTLRSSLSTSASMAAYMSVSIASAWMLSPLTCTVASALCCSLSTDMTKCHVDHIVEVALDALEPLLHVGAHSR